MIHNLRDMIADNTVTTMTPDGRWVRAVPMPFHGGLFDRLRDAWAVLNERAYAVRWPDAGDLEGIITRRAA